MSDVHQRILRTILSGAPGFLALKNKQLAYEVANPRFCQFVAKGPAEIVGKTDTDLFPGDQAALSLQEDRAVIQTGMPRKAEQSLTGPEGPRWFEVHRSPIVDDSGDPAGVFLAAYEITAYKNREDALKAGEARIAEMERTAADAEGRAVRAEEALAERESERGTFKARITELEREAGECERVRAASEAKLGELETERNALKLELETLRQRLAEAEQSLQQGQAVRAEAAALAQRLFELLGR